MPGFKEADMYRPVAELFEAQGFRVRGEVKGADLTADKDGFLIVTELKKSFSLRLVYQAMERRRAADAVYCAVPRPKGRKAARNMKELLSELRIGLIIVAMDSPRRNAEIILEPGEHPRRKSRRRAMAEQEIEDRAGSSQRGGVTREKILTAYRERALELLCILEARGSVTRKELSEMGFDKTAGDILYRNYYGWFGRKAKGTYEMSEAGKAALSDEGFTEAAAFYRERAGKSNIQEGKE